MDKKERKLKKIGLTKKTALKSVPKKKKEVKKVTGKERKTKEKIIKKGTKVAVLVEKPKTLPEPQESYVNLRCRHCYLVDGYAKTEKVCRHCGAEIYEIDII